MAPKSTKTDNETTPKPAAQVVTSKSSAGSSQQARSKFVAVSVLIAAFLIAVSAGLLTYSKHSDVQKNADVPGKSQGAMYLQTADPGEITPGQTVSVDVYENSGNDPVNAVQSAVTYPADQLEVVSVKNGTAFPQEAATDTSTKGLVRMARSIKARTPAVKGAKPIATIEFKVLPNAKKPIKLNVDQASSLIVRSTDNQNILKPTEAVTFELGQ